MVVNLDFLCCDPIAVEDGFEASVASDSIGTGTDEGILECDYDTHVTKLYHAIEERQWDEVLYFMDTNQWFHDVNNGGLSGLLNPFGSTKRPPATTTAGNIDGAARKRADHNSPAAVQARTWVTALDAAGHVRWCQLPLHAAVTFLAPFEVLVKLVQLYPKSVRCADDQDMLPLHYAFRFGADDNVLAFLLEKFPQAIGKAAVQDRLPLDLAQYGPRPERGTIIDHYMQSAVRNAKTEWDHDFERAVTSKRSTAALERELQQLKQQLSETQRELQRTQKELHLIQREQALDERETALMQLAIHQQQQQPNNLTAASANTGGGSDNGKLRLRILRTSSGGNFANGGRTKHPSAASKGNLTATGGMMPPPASTMNAPTARRHASSSSQRRDDDQEQPSSTRESPIQDPEQPPPSATTGRNLSNSNNNNSGHRRKFGIFGKRNKGGS